MLSRLLAFGAIISAVLVTGCADGDESASSSPATTSESPELLMAEALRSSFTGDAEYFDGESDPSAVRKMGETGDRRFIPVLIDVLRFPWLLSSETKLAVYTSLAALTDQSYDDLEPEQLDWGWWVEWLGTHPEVEPPPGYARWKGDLFGQLVDLGIRSFFADEGVKPRIRLEEIAWGGVARDGIPDLQNPPAIAASEADYLEPADRVFGVSFNGESRAYPLRILNPHEMANDEVGGVHFALAY